MKRIPKYSDTFYKRAVFRSVLILLSVFLLCLSICIVMIYRNNQEKMHDNAKALTQRGMNQVEALLENATRMCLFFSEYQDFSPVFQTQTEFNLRQSTMRSEMHTFLACFDYLEGISVDTDEFSLTVGNTPNDRKYKLLCEYNGFHILYTSDGKWPFQLRASGTIENPELFDVNIDISSLYLGRQYLDENTFCISKSGEILIANNTDLLGTNIGKLYDLNYEKLLTKNKIGKYIISTTPLVNDNTFIVTLVDTHSPQNNFFSQTLMLVLFCVFFLTLGIVVVLYAFQKIYQPIDKVVQMFRYFLPTENTFIEDDVRFISECVNDKNYDSDTKNAVLQLRKSQLYTLHSQISPHFLANTLDILKWESVDRLGMGNTIEESLDILSDFLAEAQQYSKMFCTIEEETKRTKQYVKLATLCFNKSLKVSWKLDKSLLRYSIVSLTLQPLLENSIIHGFISSKNKHRARINVAIYAESHNIRITISDNGSGMSPEVLNELNKTLADDGSCEHHIGLKNTHLKLKLLYGKEYGITSIISSDSGTTMELLIPARVYPTPPRTL